MIDTSDEKQQAVNLGELLVKMYEPSSVIDIGCNTGIYLVPFLLQGCDVLGVDYDREALNCANIPVLHADLSKSLLVHRKYDLAICLEVLEHIPEENASVVIHNLCKVSDKVVFSAAQIGQGGDGHVNCQTKEYWVERFVLEGFELCFGESNFIAEKMKPLQGTMGWLINNVMVFRRKVKYPIKNFNSDLYDITAVLTSCGRYDLLKRTLDSFDYSDSIRIIILDDSEDTYQHDLILSHYANKHDIIIHGKNKGQAASLDELYSLVNTTYIWHMEDDWEFIKKGTVEFSKYVLEAYPDVSTVQFDIREDYFNCGAVGKECSDFYEYKPWKIDDSHLPWNGWCGSPHLLRTSDWKKLGKFSTCQTEKQYDDLYAKVGMKTVWAKVPHVVHIGYGRSKAKGHTTWL